MRMPMPKPLSKPLYLVIDVAHAYANAYALYPMPMLPALVTWQCIPYNNSIQ